MNTIIQAIKEQFGTDVETVDIGNGFMQLGYVGKDVKTWESSAESYVSCGQPCHFLNGVLTVMTVSAQELINEKFIGRIRGFGFNKLAENVANGSVENLTPSEIAVLGTVSGLLVVEDFVPEYNREIAATVLASAIEGSVTDEQIDKFLRTQGLIKQIVEAEVALRVANLDLQCAIDNGNDNWEHGCRNAVFKQESIIRKALNELQP